MSKHQKLGMITLSREGEHSDNDLARSSAGLPEDTVGLALPDPSTPAKARRGSRPWAKTRTSEHDGSSGGVRFRGRFASGDSAAAQSPDDIEQLEADIALLREDNARLRLAQARPSDPGRLIERLRVAAETSPYSDPRDAESLRDETWQQLADAVLVRNMLIDVCAEIGQVILALHGDRSGGAGSATSQAEPSVQMHAC